MELNLPEALPPGPLAELSQALIRRELAPEEALARLAAVADDVTVGRARAQPAEHAEREFRKSLLKAKIERFSLRIAEIGREAAKQGSGAELHQEYTRIDRIKRDLIKQLQVLERSG
jgi:hypothetical protein